MGKSSLPDVTMFWSKDSVYNQIGSPNYLYNNHKLYTDNYYISLKLATDLNNYKEECTMCARHDEPYHVTYQDKYRRKHYT